MDYKWLLFSLEGRLNRQPFWFASIALAVVLIIIDFLARALFGAQSALASLVSVIVSIAAIWPSICIQGKRWHDRDKSAWWMLIGLIPLIGWVWAFVEAGCLRGTTGPNRFGKDPLSI